MMRIATLRRITTLRGITTLRSVATLLRRVVALLGLRIGKETTVARRTSGRLIVGIAVSASRRSRGWAVVIIAIVKGLVGTAGLGRWRMGGGLEQTLVTEKNKKKASIKSSKLRI